jgi:hypothetical protein
MPSRSRLKAALVSVAGTAIHAALITALAFGELSYSAAAGAAETPSEPAAASAVLSAAELEELVGPVALYPDELLAIVLPASTWPLQIVQASRFLEKHASDPDLKPDEEWDTSILGLLNYPDVVNLMNDDLNWTWQLGEAVTNQQEDLMDAVQDFRAKADGAGNLESNDNVTVTKETEADKQIIVIESTSTEVIFVPVYQPSTVVVVRTTPFPWRWWGPWPLYFRPAAVFWTGMFVGSAVGWSMRWGWRGHSSINVNRNVNVNVNRPTRPSTPTRPTRPAAGRPGAGGGERWNPDRGGQAGGRPGGDRARPATGSRPAGDRAAAGTRDRAGTGGGTGARDRASSGAGRSLTSGSKRSSGSSVGRYGSGSSARSSASRGSASRGGSRGGGSRGGGGGRRR